MKYKINKQYRYKGYNYSNEGFYFVTICTKNREMFFGDVIGKYHEKFIEDAEVKLSTIGLAAKKFWLDIPNHFPFVELDEHEIMPNHIHGIIQIKRDVGTQNLAFQNLADDDRTQNLAFQNLADDDRTQNLAFQNLADDDRTQNLAFLQYENKFGPQSKNLSSIIRGFKIGVTKYAKNNRIYFAWQPRFHDRIIRNENELNRIRQYIKNNAMKWAIDRNNIENIFM